LHPHIWFKLALSFFCYNAGQTSVVLLRVRLSAARELVSVAVRLNRSTLGTGWFRPLY